MNIVKNSNKISTLINPKKQNKCYITEGCNVQVHVYHISNVSVVGYISYNIWIVKNNNKISTSINLQNNTDVIARYGFNGNTRAHHVGPVHVHKFTRLFIDRIDINFMDFKIFLISSELWSSGYDGWLVISRPCVVGGSNPTNDKIFCNVHLFHVPCSWSGSVQMESNMTFVRGNRCIEREKDNIKSRVVKCLKECALALNEPRLNVRGTIVITVVSLWLRLLRPP